MDVRLLSKCHFSLPKSNFFNVFSKKCARLFFSWVRHGKTKLLRYFGGLYDRNCWFSPFRNYRGVESGPLVYDKNELNSMKFRNFDYWSLKYYCTRWFALPRAFIWCIWSHIWAKIGKTHFFRLRNTRVWISPSENLALECENEIFW